MTGQILSSRSHPIEWRELNDDDLLWASKLASSACRRYGYPNLKDDVAQQIRIELASRGENETLRLAKYILVDEIRRQHGRKSKATVTISFEEQNKDGEGHRLSGEAIKYLYHGRCPWRLRHGYENFLIAFIDRKARIGRGGNVQDHWIARHRCIEYEEKPGYLKKNYKPKALDGYDAAARLFELCDVDSRHSDNEQRVQRAKDKVAANSMASRFSKGRRVVRRRAMRSAG